MDNLLEQAVAENDEAAVERYLVAGANPSMTTHLRGHDVSLLYCALCCYDANIAKLLVLHNADVTFRHPIRNDGVIDVAIYVGDFKLVSMFLKKGLQPDFTSPLLKYGEWQEYPRMVAVLLKHNIHKDHPLDFGIGLLEMLIRRAVSETDDITSDAATVN